MKELAWCGIPLSKRILKKFCLMSCYHFLCFFLSQEILSIKLFSIENYVKKAVCTVKAKITILVNSDDVLSHILQNLKQL